MNFLASTDWATVLTVVLSTKVLASAIVNLTDTPKDNTAVAFAYRGLELLAGIVTRKAKQ